MAADLHIHVFENITEDDLARFFSHHLGSKYFNLDRDDHYEWPEIDPVGETDNTWIGEVSWLKAGFLGDNEKYIPGPVNVINDLIGEDLPVLDEELEKKILAALDIENTTGYSLTTKEPLAEWLHAHRGKRLFTVSW